MRAPYRVLNCDSPFFTRGEGLTHASSPRPKKCSSIFEPFFRASEYAGSLTASQIARFRGWKMVRNLEIDSENPLLFEEPERKLKSKSGEDAVQEVWASYARECVVCIPQKV